MLCNEFNIFGMEERIQNLSFENKNKFNEEWSSYLKERRFNVKENYNITGKQGSGKEIGVMYDTYINLDKILRKYEQSNYERLQLEKEVELQ